MSRGGITINDIHSYNDLGLRLLSRDIQPPTEKSAIVDDIVLRDGFTDYTASWHRKYYGTRIATYTFRALGSDNAEMIHATYDWLADVMDSNIYDDYEDGWHLRGSLADAPTATEHVTRRYTDLTVQFTCQPYWYYNDAQTSIYDVGNYTVDNPGRATTVTAAPVGYTTTVQLGGTEQTIDEETVLLEQLIPGSNLLLVTGGQVQLSWNYARL